MKSTFRLSLWMVAILGRPDIVALPVQDYMVLSQSRGHGLIDVRAILPEGGGDSETRAWAQRARCADL
jgi:hypothetical protein